MLHWGITTNSTITDAQLCVQMIISQTGDNYDEV